ncbi:peptidoglycan recognition family protein [Streptomyces sp. fd1-xmd]|uniref:peptidoglycan recognition protein family protein n=1 Tax=Streptomyces sp. fd1-xmd TaxID=1812480 RepID=UPI0009905780|nr:peptidoglycan recognition family protein [Streptomyces sp. fd1-xmd]AQT76089.1 N-acetylmuramoyl-L-alanine amidase [Streptomyces sp. fd1-xmd]
MTLPAPHHASAPVPAPAPAPGPASVPASGRYTRRSVLTGAFALATAAALPVAGAGRAYAAAGPNIIGCAAWGARAASEPVVVLANGPERIVVHHTATANVTDYSKQRAFALAKAIQTYHMDAQGWIDTGQHFTISRGAFVMEGRHHSLAELNTGRRQVRAAHCVGQNTVSIGIENEGTYTSQTPPAAQFAALADLCAHICSQYGLPASEIYGHRDFNATSCPGDRLYAMLPTLRRDVATRLGTTLSEPEEDPVGDLVRQATGRPAALFGEYLPAGLLP